MNKQHTDGPWFVGNNGHVYAKPFYTLHAPFESQGRTVSDFYNGLVALPYSCGDGDHLANAHLIAAAPDLLKACMSAIGAYEALKLIGADKELPGFQSCLDQLNKAIAKAEGTAQPTTEEDR